MRASCFFFSFFPVTLVATTALALPAPMTEEELTERADLIADVEVVSATCDGAATESSDGAAESDYVSILKVLDSTKGDEAVGAELQYFFDTTTGEVASCQVTSTPLREGWVGRVYLERVGDGYRVFDWAGTSIDPERSVEHELPECAVAEPDDEGSDGADGTSSCAIANGGSGSAGAAWIWLLGLAAIGRRGRHRRTATSA